MPLTHSGEKATTSSKVAWLLTGQLTPDEPVRRIRIDTSPFRIGRNNGMTLTIPRPTVSGAHAEFIIDGDQLLLRDLGSTNGTFVNGMRLSAPWTIHHGDLVQFAEIVFRTSAETVQECSRTQRDDSADRALALIQFDQLMVERAVVSFFQPLFVLGSMETMGYEVLGRSRLFGLSEPKAMFNAAAVLNLQGELSRMLRISGVREGQLLPGSPNLFLNTHPAELNELELLELSLREIRTMRPGSPLTLEIHETAVTEPAQMLYLRSLLRELDIMLAYDDFGAGQARFVELAEVPPDFLKFDLKLIRDIQQAPSHRQKVLENLVRMAHDLGIVPLAEGIETKEEHEFCKQIGFVLGQGFYYGRPAAAKLYRSLGTGPAPLALDIQEQATPEQASPI